MAELNIELPDFLHGQDGEVRLVGHRISLYHVASRLRDGLTIESICREFPTLTAREVSSVRTFYEDHASAVNAYVDAYAAELDALFVANPQRITTQMLKARLAERNREQAKARNPQQTGTGG